MSIALVAHRGGTDKYPELTVDAARHSLKAGADYVEIDLRFTRDGVPVISHDDNASKLFGSPLRIDELTAAEFRELRYSTDPVYRGTTLDEFLGSGVAPILFHIKVGGEKLKTIMECVRSHGLEDQVVMGATTVADVHGVKELNAGIRVLAFMPHRKMTEEFLSAGADIIRLWESWVEPEAVRVIHASNRQVWVMAGLPLERSVGYTSEENIRSWKRLGVDGILINEVEKAGPLLREA